MNQIENNDANSNSLVRSMPITMVSISIIMMFIFSTVTCATSNGTVLRNSTNASSLEVLLAPLSNVSKEEMHFRVGFLQPSTNELQRHVDFNFIVVKDGSFQRIKSDRPTTNTSSFNSWHNGYTFVFL